MNRNTNFFSAFTLIELLIVVSIIAILASIAVPNFLEASMRAKGARAMSDMRSIGIAITAYIVDYNVPPLDGYTYYMMMGGWNNPAQYPGNQISPKITSPIAYITKLPQDPFVKKAVYSSGAGGGWYSYYDHYWYSIDPATGLPPSPDPDLSAAPSTWQYYFKGKGPAYGTTYPNNKFFAYARAKGWLWSLASRGAVGEPDNTVYDRQPQLFGDKYSYILSNNFWSAGSGNNRRNLNIYDPTNGTKSFGTIYYTNRGILTITQLQMADPY